MHFVLNPLDSEPHFQLRFSSPSCLWRLPRSYCVIQGQTSGPPMSSLYLWTLQLEEQERLQRVGVCPPLRCSRICGCTATPAGKCLLSFPDSSKACHLPMVGQPSAMVDRLHTQDRNLTSFCNCPNFRRLLFKP